MHTVATMQIDKTGIEMFIGPLEAAILRALWRGKQSSPTIWRDVRAAYHTPNSEEIAYTTVTSTLHRLVLRGYVRRTGDKRRYTYVPAFETETAFVHACVRSAMWALLHNHGAVLRDVLLSLAQGDTLE